MSVALLTNQPHNSFHVHAIVEIDDALRTQGHP